MLRRSKTIYPAFEKIKNKAASAFSIVSAAYELHKHATIANTGIFIHKIIYASDVH